MSLKTKRKATWLEQYAGPEAVQLLGNYIKEADEFATQNAIPNKEKNEDVEEEAVEKEVTEEVTEESGESESDGEQFLTVKEFEAGIDAFTNEVFEPMMEVLEEQRDRIDSLTKEINTLKGLSNVNTQIDEDLETVPSFSAAQLIKERLARKLDNIGGITATKESKADDNLINMKPDENLTDSSAFSGFAQGL